MAKVLSVFGGPNGSGKSTLIERFLKDESVVNPDPIQRNLPVGTLNPEIAAARFALQEIDRRLSGETSFAVETTLTGNVERRLFDQAKALGWTVNLYYVGLEQPELNAVRVAQRALQGGQSLQT